MPRLLRPLLLAAVAAALLTAGCGGDDKKDSDTGAPAAQTAEATPAAADETPAAEETVALDDETLRAFIDAINEDPTILCDPANVTAELLEMLGGAETCKTGAAEEEAGGEYTIDDLTIDGETATAVITDKDSTDTVTFVLEAGEIKLASSSSE